MKKLIGRKKEQEILKEAFEYDEAEMVAVLGRRRVGKTFLINTTYEDHIDFKVTGIQNVPTAIQLQNFNEQLNKFSEHSIAAFDIPKDWFQAFSQLEKYIKVLPKEKRKVIFLDEVPWMAASHSNFISAFGHFWNNWASLQNLVVVICGSATSWMIQKIVMDTGGLHNRITKYIHLKPFTLFETEEYMKSRNLNFNRYQIVQLYMAMGGVPHYLKELKKGKSAVQNIDAICFSKLGILKNEFLKLYPALFKYPENHIAIVRALATKKNGLSRQEIITKAGTPKGGGTTKTLEELEQSGFITSYHPFGKRKKEKLFRLTDEYSLFYLNFIEDKTNEGAGTWNHLSQSQYYKTWSGYAFESICLKHVPQIKKALGISGVYSKSASFLKKGTKTEPGTQIDLLIDRSDNVVNIAEIKFHNSTFTVTKDYANRLRNKRDIFVKATKTKKHPMIILITTFGLNQNQYSLEMIEQVLTLDDLFEVS